MTCRRVAEAATALLRLAPMNRTLPACGLFLLGLASCDPLFTLKGRAIAQGGEGIAQAEALVVCNGAAYKHATSGTDGSFATSGVGACAQECEVVVRAAGFDPYRAPVSRHCTKKLHLDSRCVTVELEASLKPRDR